MAPTLYMIPSSPAVRAVRMTAEALNVDLNLEMVDFSVGAHHKADYLRLNPAHTVPTLVDDDFVLWDSHAIMTYLVGKYGKDDSLYPKDLQQRAKVDQLLHFDGNVVFARSQPIFKQVFLQANKDIPEASIVFLNDAYKSLNGIIADNDYVTGSKPTLADLSLISTITSINHLVPIDEEKYPNITAWRKRVEQLPYYGPNEQGLQCFKDFVKSKIG